MSLELVISTCKILRNYIYTVYSWLQEVHSFLYCNNRILTTLKATNIAICNISIFLSGVLVYCIAVVNITIYRYIVILLHPYYRHPNLG